MKLRNECLETPPERRKFVRFGGVQREHGVVVAARFLDVRELGQQEAENHDVSPSIGLNAVRGKPADAEVVRIMGAATNVYSLSSGKGEWHMG